MLKQLRETIKRTPVIGPLLYDQYLKLFYNEGREQKISGGGPLAGKTWIRFMRTHSDLYLSGDYEMPLQRAIAQHLKPGMTFYDVGANAGFFTLLGSSIVGNSGSVVAFEPHPLTASHMKSQLQANKLSNVTLVEAAVCDRIGTARFSDDTLPVEASLGAAAQSKRTILVATTTLDEVVKTRRSPDVIKIDIEGAEIEALAGARGLLSRKRPILLVELHSRQIAIAYANLMDEMGYDIMSLNGARLNEMNYEADRFVISRSAD